jgi:Tfp pilus assembly protein PilF
MSIRWSEIQAHTRWALLVVVLALLAGCATQGKIKPAPAEPAVEARAAARGPSATQLEDGREGFMITEIPRMDQAAREDFQRAVAMLAAHDDTRAIELFEKVIRQSPGVTAPYIDVAIAYERTGKPEKAEKHLKTALSLVPDHPAACNEYGLLCRKAGRFGEARTMYEKALARFPDYYPAHRNLGILCDLYLNDTACAMAHYEFYSAAKPEDEQVKMWIADLHNRMGVNE